MIQNAGAEAEDITVAVSASAAELLNSVTEATLEDGRITARLYGGETVFIQLHNTRPAGLYIGNVLYRVLPSRPVTFWAENAAYCAVYTTYGGRRELRKLYTRGESFVPLANENVKIFRWDTLRPREAVIAFQTEEIVCVSK